MKVNIGRYHSYFFSVFLILFSLSTLGNDLITNDDLKYLPKYHIIDSHSFIIENETAQLISQKLLEFFKIQNIKYSQVESNSYKCTLSSHDDDDVVFLISLYKLKDHDHKILSDIQRMSENSIGFQNVTFQIKNLLVNSQEPSLFVKDPLEWYSTYRDSYKKSYLLSEIMSSKRLKIIDSESSDDAIEVSNAFKFTLRQLDKNDLNQITFGLDSLNSFVNISKSGINNAVLYTKYLILSGYPYIEDSIINKISDISDNLPIGFPLEIDSDEEYRKFFDDSDQDEDKDGDHGMRKYRKSLEVLENINKNTLVLLEEHKNKKNYIEYRDMATYHINFWKRAYPQFIRILKDHPNQYLNTLKILKSLYGLIEIEEALNANNFVNDKNLIKLFETIRDFGIRKSSDMEYIANAILIKMTASSNN